MQLGRGRRLLRRARCAIMMRRHRIDRQPLMQARIDSAGRIDRKADAEGLCHRAPLAAAQFLVDAARDLLDVARRIGIGIALQQ